MELLLCQNEDAKGSFKQAQLVVEANHSKYAQHASITSGTA